MKLTWNDNGAVRQGKTVQPDKINNNYVVVDNDGYTHLVHVSKVISTETETKQESAAVLNKIFGF